MANVAIGWPTWIGVVARDFAAQRRFYEAFLDFEELESGDGWTWFDGGNGRLFELLKQTADPQYDRPRYQVGFSVADIEQARSDLIAAGADPLTELEGDSTSGGRWCYFKDPEANVFALKEGAEPTEEAATNGLGIGWPTWIGVVARDLAAQRRFYRDVLNFQELEVGDDWIWLDGGNGRLFELLEQAADPQYDRPRYQVGFAVADIEHARSDLIEAGVNPLTELEGGPTSGGRWCYFTGGCPRSRGI